MGNDRENERDDTDGSKTIGHGGPICEHQRRSVHELAGREYFLGQMQRSYLAWLNSMFVKGGLETPAGRNDLDDLHGLVGRIQQPKVMLDEGWTFVQRNLSSIKGLGMVLGRRLRSRRSARRR
jgi:hypothetical protein